MRSCYWPDGTDDHGSYNGEAGSSFADTYTRGLRGPDDIVWHILD